MRKESAIIRKCSAQRTGEPFHYASIQHILSNVMNAGILRSGETKSEVFPELQIVSLEQFNRVAKTREQRSVNYAIKCGGTTETVQLEDGTEATVVRPPPRLSSKDRRKSPLVRQCVLRSLRWPHFCSYR